MRVGVLTALCAGMVVFAGVAEERVKNFPSPTWCVRACPEGAASARRLWQGIPPLVKTWELQERAEALARLGRENAPQAKPEFSVDLPEGANAAQPVPVVLVGASANVPVQSICARGYACVRMKGMATAAVLSAARQALEARAELDSSRVIVVGTDDADRAALQAAARDERFAMVVTGTAESDALGLVAPRLAYVVNGPSNELAAAQGLYRAYRLGERLASVQRMAKGAWGAEDWSRFLDFADRHLKAPSTADSDAIDRRIAGACADGSRAVTLTLNAAAPDGVWRLTRAIRVPDDFTLVFDGCRVEQVDGTQDNLVRNAGAAEGACQPNHGIRILGRNGATLSGGRRNHYLPKRSGDPNGWRSVGILLCDVSDYEVGGFKMEETQCWAISQERCFKGHVHDIEFGSTDVMYNQDGVDLRKGCHDILIENISGSVGDDAVALTAYHDPVGAPPRYGMQIGGNADLGERDDVYNVTIRNVHARSAGGHGVIRLLVCDGIKMHHISVEGVVDTATGDERRPQATIRLGDVSFHKVRRCQMGEMHHITVKDVKASGKVAVWMKGPMCDSSVTGITPGPGGKRYDITAPLERVALDPDGHAR